MYYNQSLETPPEDNLGNALLIRTSPALEATLSESADMAAVEAERIFWKVVRSHGSTAEGDEEVDAFWPAAKDLADAEDNTDQW